MGHKLYAVFFKNHEYNTVTLRVYQETAVFEHDNHEKLCQKLS